MGNILAQSTQEINDLKHLLSKDIPTYRQAYSDRTSWLMACLSELVYVKFNQAIINKNDTKLVEAVSQLLGNEKAFSLSKLINLLAYDCEAEKNKLKSDLDTLNMKVEKFFDTKGTQAMLVSSDKFYTLCFRGTEPTSMRDIKADLNASLMQCESKGKIHTGFNNAFADVHNEVQEYLNTLDNKPLFITGHSLGGALATVATKKLKYAHGIAACYTYGSPRVGDEAWGDGISKVPLYRIVNAFDPVTMMPPGDGFISVLSLLCKSIPYIGLVLSNYLKKFAGYYHVGDMRYLTHVDNGDYKSVKLLYGVSFFRRLKALRKKSLSKIPADHSITVYRKKLKAIAIKRN